jgi:hypothetical protein
MQTWLAGSLGAGQVMIKRTGVNLTVGNYMEERFNYVTSASTSNNYTFNVNSTSFFRINFSTTTPFEFINPSGPVAIGAGGLTISTPLGTASGGTGLTTVGTNGQVLTSNGTSLSWTTPAAPGTGTVTSVAATVPAFLSITGSPITSSGTLAISYSGSALPTANGGTGSTSASTGSGGVVLATSPTLVTPNIGVATGTSLAASSLVNAASLQATGTVAVASQGCHIQWNRSGTQGESWILNQKGTGIGASGIVFGKVTTGNVSTEQMRIADSGVVSIENLTASSAVATDGSKNLVSVTNTGTGNNVLANSPTLITPTLGAASATTLTASSSITIAGGSNPALNITTGTESVSLGIASGAGNFSSSAAVGDLVLRNVSKAVHIQSGTGASAMSIATNNFITIRQPLTIATTTNTAGLTYILECLNSNTTLGSYQGVNIGQSRTDGNCLLLGYRYDAGSDNPNNAAFISLFGTNKPTLKLQNNGTATFENCSLIATPRWGNGYLASDQIIPFLSNALITWTASTAGPLTRTSTRFTYTGTTDIFVQVSFTANWKPLGATFFSGVWISVRKNGSALYNVTKTIVDSIRVTSTSSTTIVPLSTNDYFEILATNLETNDTTIFGGGFLISDCATMTYNILN